MDNILHIFINLQWDLYKSLKVPQRASICVTHIRLFRVWENFVSVKFILAKSYGMISGMAIMQTEVIKETKNRYDSIARCMPDAFTGLLERIRQLELELGHLPQKWRVRWDQLELPNTVELQVAILSIYFTIFTWKIYLVNSTSNRPIVGIDLFRFGQILVRNFLLS